MLSQILATIVVLVLGVQDFLDRLALRFAGVLFLFLLLLLLLPGLLRLLALRGMGRGLWKAGEADEYVRSLREDWA